MKRALLLLLLCSGCGESSGTGNSAAPPSVPPAPAPEPAPTESVISAPKGSRFKHVVEVVFENTNFQSALKQADFAALVKRGALMTNLKAQNHPSQGNYIAMVAADTLGVKTDGVVNLAANHLGDLLEEAHLDWRVYSEAYPGNCFLASTKGHYARKHNPFLSFTNVSKDPLRCAKVENDSGFERDVQNHALPAYALYVPDLLNDGHDTGIAFAGKYLSRKFGPILDNPSLMADTLFIFTFDENSGASGNQVFTVLVGPSVKPGTIFGGAISHPSLVRLIEDEFRLGSLHRLDEKSILIEGIWQ